MFRNDEKERDEQTIATERRAARVSQSTICFRRRLNRGVRWETLPLAIMFGYTPKIHWHDNADGSTRSIDEAVAIARDHGVYVPDLAAFFVDDLDELSSLAESITARGPKVTKPPGGIVVLDDLLNRFGQVPFIVRADILKSDEAIVAVIAHEMHELNGLLPLLREGQLTIEQFNAHTSATNFGNLHYEAWDIADKLVEEIRRRNDDF